MHRRLLRIALAASMVAIAFPSVAQIGGEMPQDGITVLYLSETVERLIPRNRARAELRAEIYGPDPREIQQEINRTMKVALERVNGDRPVETATGSYSVQRVNRRAASQDQAGEIWIGRQSLSLTGTDIPAVLEMAGTLQSQGLIMSGLRFDIAPETAKAVHGDLTEIAIRSLQERAARIARTMGLRIDHYSSVNVSDVSNYRPVPYHMTMSADIGSERAEAPVVAEPGEETISVQVSVSVRLKPLK